MDNTTESKATQIRKKVNEKVFSLGTLKISLVHLLFLVAINTSLVCIIINFFAKGTGIFEWWSVFVTVFLIFSYLVIRIFTSSGIILGRQVTFLITLFNLFLNLMKTFGIVAGNQHWELTFLIPLVNLICLVFLVFVFAVRKKRFRAIIVPSLKISLVSIIPIVRLYFIMGNNYILPVFNYVVLVLAFALFVNALFLNWLNIVRIAEKNIEMVKKGADEFKKASQKVATANRKIDSFNAGIGKVKSFWKTSGAAFKEFFTYRKKKEINSSQTPLIEESSSEQDHTIVIEDTKSKQSDQKPSTKGLYAKVKQKLLSSSKATKQSSVETNAEEELVLCDKEESDQRGKKKIYNKLLHSFKSKK